MKTLFLWELIDAGCYLKRHGKKHDIYVNQEMGERHLFHVIPKLGRASVARTKATWTGVKE